jgi:hypothetical protein
MKFNWKKVKAFLIEELNLQKNQERRYSIMKNSSKYSASMQMLSELIMINLILRVGNCMRQRWLILIRKKSKKELKLKNKLS